ncbi:MAG TPA: hypothetical protein VKW04_18540 [Planctomycetota bacterium]|nr:hypothetical protein [Planctomycetota bacterium]
MSNNSGPIPKGAVFFAHQIVDRFRLEKASSIGFIETAIVAALRDQEDIRHARELVGCATCGILLSRYACILERFGTSCPKCRNPMAARDVLHLKRIAELEDQVKRLEGRAVSAGSSPAPSSTASDGATLSP